MDIVRIPIATEFVRRHKFEIVCILMDGQPQYYLTDTFSPLFALNCAGDIISYSDWLPGVVDSYKNWTDLHEFIYRTMKDPVTQMMVMVL